MSSPSPSRAARRRRIARRRRFVAVVISVVVVVALVVGIFGFVRSLGERPPGGAAPVAAAGSSAGDTAAHSDAAPADAPTFDPAAAADEAMAAMGDYSDAARATEDALYAASEKLRSANSATTADAALAETQQALAAVKADAEAYRARLIAASAGTDTQPTGGDVAAQMAYLHQYVFAYNPEWGDYNPYGGDCTNFASQGLIARGWSIDRTWYSKGAMWTASKPWIASAPMAAYFDKLGFDYSTEADLDRVRVGDIGLFSWGETQAGMDHTMTVSKVDYVPGGPPTVYFISHNENGEYRELTNALYVEHQNSTVRIYHIP